MSDDTRPEKETLSHLEKPDHFAVMLPCATDEFGEFISGLLGKPQTIEKSIDGIFEIERDDVVNTYHLVDQRIRQQNEATLIQFTARIIYDDDSSVLINSIDDFTRYTEIRPIASIGITMSWTYLILFKNKRVPEKQEINLTFRSGYGDGNVFFGSPNMFLVRKPRWFGPPGVYLRIRHTERTWGVDIESLLTGHVKTLFKEPRETEKFLCTYSETIGAVAGILFFLSAIVGTFVTYSKFIDSYLEKVEEIADVAVTNAGIFSSKLDFLIEVISTGIWPRFVFSVIIFLVLALIFSLFLGAWVGEKANNRPNSFVLLSKAAEENKITLENKRRRDWGLFGLSIVTGIAASLIANIIFTIYFGDISLQQI